MSSAPHQNILPRDKIDHAGDVLARESISQAPKGTSIIQAGRDAALPTFAVIRSNMLTSIIPDFQKGVQLREAEKHARPFRLTDVPAERFANAIRLNEKREKGAKSGYEAVDEHGTQQRKKAVMYEDTNYIGIANLQIYAFFGLTAAAGLGTVLILASLKKFPQLLFALPFALFSGWQMYGYYLSTRAAAEQATKVQYLRMVQGGLADDPDRTSKFVKKPQKNQNDSSNSNNNDDENESSTSSNQNNNRSSEEQLQADESQKIVPETTKSDVKKKEAKTEETQLTSDNKKNADEEMNKLGNLKIPGRD